MPSTGNYFFTGMEKAEAVRKDWEMNLTEQDDLDWLEDYRLYLEQEKERGSHGLPRNVHGLH